MHVATAIYQLVLVGGDGDEDGLGKDERLVMLIDFAADAVRRRRFARRGVALLEHEADTRLVLVHRVQNDLHATVDESLHYSQRKDASRRSYHLATDWLAPVIRYTLYIG